MSSNLAELLATPLVRLAFPARMEGFIQRRGLVIVRDLVAISPSSLLLEPNLGRKSVADAGRLLREHLGISWDAARAGEVPQEARSSYPAPQETVAEEWAALAVRLDAQTLAADVHGLLDFPTRIQTFAAREKIASVAELVAVPYEDLARADGIGAGTLRRTLEMLRRLVTHVAPLRQAPSVALFEPPPPPPDPLPPGSTWQVLLHQSLRRLDSKERLIVTQRAGLAGPIPTLLELGECFGVSRERIRQIESKALERLRRELWIAPARERLAVAAPGTLSVVGAWESADELFRLADDEVEPFAFFVNDVLIGPIRVEPVEDRRVITTLTRDAAEQLARSARAHARALSYPLQLGSHLDALAVALGVARAEVERLAPLLDGEWIIDQDVVTGFGTTRLGAILAHVRAAGRPVAKTEIEERFGRGQLPPDLVFVDYALLAVPDIIPDWARWKARLPPVVRSLLERHGPSRQWSTHELVPLLAEEAELPPWLNDWTLGSLLRDVPEVRYLGRNVVALEAQADGRLNVERLATEILEQAGEPLLESALLTTLRERRGLGAHTWGLLRMRRPFVFFDGGRIGMMPRDVPGGQSAVDAFGDEAFALLDARQAGLPATELRALIEGHTGPVSAWDLWLARSVLRHDGRFRLSTVGAVGLAEWGATRAPTQQEVLEELMIEHDGVVPVEVAMATLPTSSGEPLGRGRIGLLANSIRARLVGAYIEWMPELSDAELPARSPFLERILSALPEDTAAVFSALLDAATDARADDLEQRLEEWARAMKNAATSNVHVELAQVEGLADQARSLLARARATSDADAARACRAAVSYLAAVDDAQTDTALGGLDDDEIVLRVVSESLGGKAT